MKVIIAGGRDFNDYEILKKAVKQSGFDITEVISGGAKGADSLGERWASENNIPCKIFKAEWNNLYQTDARIKTNQWGQKYNANAGFYRNERMAAYADALIAVKGGAGTAHMIKQAKEYKLAIYIYEKDDADYEYHF